jgi:hypothetical protein
MQFDKIPIPKKESPIDKVVGATEELEFRIREKVAKDTKEAKYSRSVYEKYDQEFSVEHLELISEIGSLLPRFLQEYGLEEALEMDPEMIYIFDASLIKAAGMYEVSGGKVEIGVSHGQLDNLVNFSHILSHEMIHAQSFHSLDMDYDERKTGYSPSHRDEHTFTSVYDSDTDSFPLAKLRRIGLKCLSNEGDEQVDHFRWLNEAITERLTITFLETHTKDIQLIAHRELTWKNKLFIAYPKERLALDNLIKLLYSTGHYESEEEAFKLFTHAMLNGRLLPIARAIEKVRGQGAFRELASFKPSLIAEFLKKKLLY